LTEQPDRQAETLRLLDEAQNALRSISLRLLAVSPYLKEPYTDSPDQSPWSFTIGPEAARAHALSIEIRKHMGTGHQRAQRAVATQPLTVADALLDEAANGGTTGRSDLRKLLAEARAVLDEINQTIADTPNGTKP
jgi:hypothetical protein